MKQILFENLPNKMKDTIIYNTCNDFEEKPEIELENNTAFEEYFRCKLSQTHLDTWICTFEEIDYTWFILKWS